MAFDEASHTGIHTEKQRLSDSEARLQEARLKLDRAEEKLLDQQEQLQQAAQGALSPRLLDRDLRAAMAEFRGRPNKLGRARMFAEKSVGMDDPGMRAFQIILTGLASRQPAAAQGLAR